MINILEAQRAGLFAPKAILNNVVAGVIVGIVALPLAMAFAIASGARPEQGLYTAVVAGLLVSLLGGSRLQIAGPTGAFVTILSGITANYGIEGLQIATAMAGVMLILMGAAKMGGMIKFIPSPVILGFTAGIGIIIWVGQWRYFLGLPAVSGRHFHEVLWHSMLSVPSYHPATTLIGVLSLLLIVLAPKVRGLRRVPGPLVAMLVATVIQSIFRFDGVATIGSAFGGIPQHLPAFAVPALSASRVVELIGPAFTIAMLGAIESLLSAVVADGMAGTKHDPNQELIGQGIANVVAPLFGGFAATGAVARTATNARNGGTSPLAGMIHATTLVLIILFLAPLASNVPLTALAAILFVVAYNMSEIQHLAHMIRRAPRADAGILVITLLLTIFTDLVVAVNIGVILATLQFLRRMASSVEVQQQTEAHLGVELANLGWSALPEGTLVYAIDGPFFFGAVENFERVLALSHTDPRILILRLHRVPFMDMTGLLTLEEVVGKLQHRGVRVMLCEANERVKGKLAKAGLLAMLGAENHHADFGQALKESGTAARQNSPARHMTKEKLNAAAHKMLATSKDFFLGERH